ncbi:MAG TPA: hypothetical protein DGG95_04395 [Cytophagales bacterium]|jgi:outer membrane protein OmpA-like peptidoglycan-associated protein/tetratricopeptide (TPR) repeat protein|nr:hypothetical protein [Cytophagales bacterium]
MKNILIAAVILITFVRAQAQARRTVNIEDPSFSQAEKLYKDDKYSEAIPLYEDFLKSNPEHQDCLYHLGLCYRYTSQPQKAIDLLKKLEQVNANYWPWFYYEMGVAYTELFEYDLAVERFKEFNKKYLPTSTNEIYRHQAKYKMNYAANQKVLKEMPNSMKDAIKLSNIVNSDYQDAFPYLDPTGTKLYFSSKRLGGITLEEPTAKEGDDDLYFTIRSGDSWSAPQLLPEPINSSKNEGAPCFSGDGQTMVYTACNRDDAVGSCDLYISSLEGDEWTKPINVGNVVNSKDWDSQPTISADGNKIIFVSDRPGGYGSYDLYMTEKNIFGDWGPACNLGGMINTPFGDTSPFLSQDGKTLYFASTGHPGYGSYDLFKTVFENGKWSLPVNLGKPLNTSGDDRFFTIGGNGEIGYFSSDRDKGDDLYQIEIPESMRPKPTIVVEGIVTNAKTNSPVAAYVMVEDIVSGELIAVNKSNSVTGKYLVVLPSGRDYSVTANKEAFFFYSQRFNVPPTSQYREIKKDIPLRPIEKGAKVILNNIFFETGKATLSPESRLELQKAIDLMKMNPSMIIEVGGHTDNVGDDASNMKLSHDRAKSVRDYLVQGGIASTRLQAKGYGELNPVADNETEEGRQANRRTEFVILEF